MAENSTKQLAKDVDTAIRDTYHALRTALHKVEDLKMQIIEHPEINPFGPQHNEMYKMYLDLSARFQATREEISSRAGPVQVQAPTPEPAPGPHMEEPRQATKQSPIRRSMGRPYVLVPPRSSSFNPAVQDGRNSQSRQTTTLGEGGSKGKRKATGLKKDVPSDSDSEIVIEHFLSTKRAKIHHDSQEADNEVEVLALIDDSERSTSPLTEMSSSPMDPLPDVPSNQNPAGLLTGPHTRPTPPFHPSSTRPARASRSTPKGPGGDLKELGSESSTSDTALKALPTLGSNSPASKASSITSGSGAGEEKMLVSIDKKPKLKGKKKGASDFLDDALLDRRLLAVGPDLEVDNDRITHQHVGPNSRKTMSKIFGGSRQRMISYPSPEKRQAHGFNLALLFPNRAFNPFLPTKLGERGLLFRLNQELEQWADLQAPHDDDNVGPYHLMMHHGTDDYCYFGVYKFLRVDPVTKDEWLAQEPQLRDTWVDYALRTGTGKHTRARVFLRRSLGREPELCEVNGIKKENDLKTKVTAAQIMEDFNSGEEKLVIWGMKCIDYDYDFEKYLADNLAVANST